MMLRPIIPGIKRLGQEDCKSKAGPHNKLNYLFSYSLDYIANAQAHTRAAVGLLKFILVFAAFVLSSCCTV